MPPCNSWPPLPRRPQSRGRRRPTKRTATRQQATATGRRSKQRQQQRWRCLWRWRLTLATAWLQPPPQRHSLFWRTQAATSCSMGSAACCARCCACAPPTRPHTFSCCSRQRRQTRPWLQPCSWRCPTAWSLRRQGRQHLRPRPAAGLHMPGWPRAYCSCCQRRRCPACSCLLLTAVWPRLPAAARRRRCCAAASRRASRRLR